MLHPASSIGHPSRGAIWLDVNGKRRQQGDLADMIWDVAHTVHFLSQYYELLPGDLIFTGTPAGVGAVVPGDRLDGGIDGLGTLSLSIEREIGVSVAANHGAAPAYTPEFVERGYNNRAAVPDHPRWLAYYPQASAEARAALAPKTDLRYGPGPKETLDLFLPAGSRARHVRVHSRRLLARVRQERLLVRRDPVRRSGPARSPWSTTIFVPTCRSPRSSTSVAARCAGSSARARRTARIPAASWSAGILPAGT